MGDFPRDQDNTNNLPLLPRHCLECTECIIQSMRFYNFEIVIEKEPEDEGYLAYCPALPGCFSDGLTIEEARIKIREALQQHLTVLLDQGEEIPQRDSIVHVEELSVGIPS